MSGYPVLSNQIRTFGIINSKSKFRVVTHDDQMQNIPLCSEAPASLINIVYQEDNQSTADNISLADT